MTALSTVHANLAHLIEKLELQKQYVLSLEGHKLLYQLKLLHNHALELDEETIKNRVGYAVEQYQLAVNDLPVDVKQLVEVLLPASVIQAPRPVPRPGGGRHLGEDD